MTGKNIEMQIIHWSCGYESLVWAFEAVDVELLAKPASCTAQFKTLSPPLSSAFLPPPFPHFSLETILSISQSWKMIYRLTRKSTAWVWKKYRRGLERGREGEKREKGGIKILYRRMLWVVVIYREKEGGNEGINWEREGRYEERKWN